MVTMPSLTCHPHVDKELGEAPSLASMSGTLSTVHRHPLSKPRALPAPGPHNPIMPSLSACEPRARQSVNRDTTPPTLPRPSRLQAGLKAPQQHRRHARLSTPGFLIPDAYYAIHHN